MTKYHNIKWRDWLSENPSWQIINELIKYSTMDNKEYNVNMWNLITYLEFTYIYESRKIPTL